MAFSTKFGYLIQPTEMKECLKIKGKKWEGMPYKYKKKKKTILLQDKKIAYYYPPALLSTW